MKSVPNWIRNSKRCGMINPSGFCQGPILTLNVEYHKRGKYHFHAMKHYCHSCAAAPEQATRIQGEDVSCSLHAVGSIMYAMVSTRPDIAHAVGVVSSFMSNPGREHWEAVKWILRYLRGTSGLAITFGGESASSVVGFVDADYAGDVDTRRSTTGFIFSMSGGPISWRSTLQASVALSTTEAEYMAAVYSLECTPCLSGAMFSLSKKSNGWKVTATLITSNGTCRQRGKQLSSGPSAI